MGTETELGTIGVGRRPAGPDESARANRRWWDADAVAYHAEHGPFLGSDDFVWCPEGLREEDASLLGPQAELRGRRILEVGGGSAMCSRWLLARGAHPVSFDVSAGMLAQAGRHGAQQHSAQQHGAQQHSAQQHGAQQHSAQQAGVPLVQADAQRMPFRTGSFDLAFTAYGAVPFVADSAGVMREVARVLRPGGRWVFSASHPMRWCFPDSAGPDGLTASMSYFDRRPYVEFDAANQLTYVEHHRTLGDRLRELVAAGFTVLDVVEPEWPDELIAEWGQWSPLRGKILPGTAIYISELR